MMEELKRSQLPDPSAPLNGSCQGNLLERLLKQDPAKRAIEGTGEVWSYSELYRASADLSHCLAEVTPCKGPVVAIYAIRSPMLVVAILGIMRAGGALLILDPSNPPLRNRQCAALARPEAFINLLPQDIPEDLVQGKPVIHVPATKTELLENPLARCAAANRANVTDDPERLLYIAFTSGSTGFPRAVFGTSRPVLHFLVWQQQQFGLHDGCRVSMLSGLSHDPLLRDILMPLSTGGTICVPPQTCYNTPYCLFQWVREAGINVIHLTPSLCSLLLNRGPNKGSLTLDSLAYAFLGGEALSARIVRKLKGIAPGVTVVNCYGTTETPQVKGFFIVTQQDVDGIQQDGESALVPIGRGIADVQLLVLDENSRLCGPEVEGQIYVRSPYLAQEVRDVTGRKIDAFRTNPYTSDPCDRIYPTGDYGFYRTDGTVVYVGRKDKQLKILGYRVQLEELEMALAADSELLDYRLVPETSEAGDISLSLYVVPKNPLNMDLNGLKARLKARFPDYMVPQRTAVLSRIPITPNGKMDLTALKQFQGAEGKTGEEQTSAVSGSIEIRLLRTLSRVISYPGLRLDDNLLEVGINSLQAINACCAIEDEFAVTLGCESVVRDQTVARLADLLRRKVRRAVDAEPVGDLANPLGGSNQKREPRLGSESQVRLLPRNENPFVGIKNRVLQLMARISPEYWRARLHRLRGVRLGSEVSIGYDTIIETAYPWLVRIGHHANIGMRVTVVAHFRGMARREKGTYTVDIQDYVFIGPHVVILPNVSIGRGAVITAGSVVNTDIPPFVLAHGNPAVPIARCGVALAGATTYEEFLRRLEPL